MAVNSLSNGHYNESVVSQLPMFGGYSQPDIALYLGTVADSIPAWGTNVRYRDIELRRFYKTESMLSGTVFGTASRYASFKYVLSGPERQCGIMQRVLHNSEHGKGWIKLWIPVIKDMLTQDNGAILECIRTEDDPRAMTIQLNHLDSSRCTRTGNWEVPIIYRDLYGSEHRMKWYQVYDLCEYPDPDERMRGYQECAISRLLTDAQKMRDIAVYEKEKVSGRNPASVHFIGGIQQQRINSILKLDQNRLDNEGFSSYQVPPIIAALDQNARVSHEQVDLRSLPDGYDKDSQMRWYVIELALAFGLDPQDIAPLPGGNLGSAQQSSILAQKGRGKGPALFMSSVQHMMNFHGIMPKTVQFTFAEQDDAENEALTNLQWRRTQMYAMMAKPNGTKGTGTPGSSTATGSSVDAGDPLLPTRIVRQIMRDNGDLKQEYLDALGEKDITPQIELSSDDKSWFRKLIKR